MVPRMIFAWLLILYIQHIYKTSEAVSTCGGLSFDGSIRKKSSYSFCCCRDLLVRTNESTTIATNSTDNSTIKTTTVTTDTFLKIKILNSTVYQEISLPNKTLFNKSLMDCLQENTTIDNATERIEECHCSNTYENLKDHREVSNSSRFYCPLAKIYIGGFFDLHSLDGLRILPAAQIAIDEINANDSYSSGYQLVLINDNSTNKDLHNFGTHILLNHLLKEHTKAFLLGPSNNLLAKSVAAIAGLDQFNVLQVSPGTDDLQLTYDRVAYNNFFRTDKSLQNFIDARLQILLYYKWRKVGLLYSSEPFYFQLNLIQKEILVANGITITHEESFHSNPAGSLRSLKEHGVKVILGSYPDVHSSKVFCEIYNQEMFSPIYVFLMMNAFEPTSALNCSAEKVGCAARHQFFLKIKPFCIENDAGIIQRRNTFLNKYKSLVPGIYLNDAMDNAYYMYDTVWTIAHALQSAKTALQTINVNLDQISYGKTEARSRLRAALLNTNIYGLTGTIQFDWRGNRLSDVIIYQNVGINTFVHIGEYEFKHNLLRLKEVRWLGWRPHQEVITQKTYKYVDYKLHLALVVLSLIGMFFSLFLFVYIIVQRRSIIRNTFYEVNLVLIIGSVFGYLAVICFVTDSNSNILNLSPICLLRKVFSCLAFAMMVGPLLVKLYAAFRIRRKNISHMEINARSRTFCYLLFILLVTGVLLLLWCTVFPMKMILKEIEEEKIILCSTFEINFDPFTRKILHVNVCHSFSYLSIFMIAWFVFLLCLALYFAVKTRHMFISSMIDTWQCGWCVYVIVFFMLVSIVTGFLTTTLPTLFAVIVGMCIWLCITLVLLILFMYLIIGDESDCCKSGQEGGCCCFSVLLCCCCDEKKDDSLSKHEDLFQKYHNNLPQSSSNNRLSSTMVSFDHVILNGTSLKDEREKKAKKNRSYMGKSCCKAFSWFLRGVPNPDTLTDNEDDDGANNTNNNNNNMILRNRDRLGRVMYRRGRRKRRTIATQTDRPYNTKDGNKEDSLVGDEGDGLKNFGYEKIDNSPLRIYNKKPDWSYVKSYLKINENISTIILPNEITEKESNSVIIKKDASGTTTNVNHTIQSEEEGKLGIVGNSFIRTLKLSPRRNTMAPNFKNDYSHVRPSVNTGTKVSRLGTRDQSVKSKSDSLSHKGMITSTLNEKVSSRRISSLKQDSDKKTGSVQSGTENNKKLNSIQSGRGSPSPINSVVMIPSIQITDASQETKKKPGKTFRVVNGPGSSVTPKQPMQRFLQRKSLKVTTLNIQPAKDK